MTSLTLIIRVAYTWFQEGGTRSMFHNVSYTVLQYDKGKTRVNIIPIK